MGPPVQNTEQVYKYDGSVQCGWEGVPPEVMEEELTEAGIDVLAFRKDHDGRGYAAVCGNGTGRINVYEIRKTDVIRALELGFHLLSDLLARGDRGEWM